MSRWFDDEDSTDAVCAELDGREVPWIRSEVREMVSREPTKIDAGRVPEIADSYVARYLCGQW